MTLIQDSSHPDGVYDDAGKNDGKQVVRARDRKAAAAIKLRQDGMTWDDVAEVIGYPTARHAIVATERYCEANLQAESRDALRQMVSERYQRLVRAAMGKAEDDSNPEQLAAIAKVRDLTSDFVKLHGLAAPTEVSIHSPSESEIEAFVGKVVGKMVPQLEQDDIFEDVVDADVVEDCDHANGVAGKVCPDCGSMLTAVPEVE